jgi:hypothetical protein
VIISSAFKRLDTEFTISRFVAGIGHMQALIGTFVPVAEGVNLSKMEFFNVVARLESSPVEFSYALDQGSQTHIHQRLCVLSLED